jgi:hypothetical protein
VVGELVAADLIDVAGLGEAQAGGGQRGVDAAAAVTVAEQERRDCTA